MAKLRTKTIACRNCGKRFVPKKAGRGIGRIQRCPYCKRDTERPMSKSETKKLAWDAFSQWVRRQKLDRSDRCQCVTCGEWHHWSEMQAGHFLDSRSKGILFHEECCHPQCYRCNVALNGNKDAYWPWMLDRYGREKCDELLRLKWRGGEWTIDELRQVHETYRSKLDDLDRFP